MPGWLEDLGVYALLAAIWIGVPVYIFLKLRSRRTPGRMKAEPVESNLPRTQRERVTEIDAAYGADYRGPGRKGEPFFSPGGVALLLTLVAGFIFSIWFSDLIRPLVDWLVPPSRR